MNGELMNEKDVSSFLGIRAQTLAVWRMKKEKLPFIRIGRRVAYRREDVERFLETNTVNVGLEAAP